MFTFSRLRATREPDFVIGNGYLRRWWLIPRNRFLNIYLHEINKSDDDRALHDHPWHNVSVVLKGGYQEVTPDGVYTLRSRDIKCRSGSFLHRLVIPEGGQAVTLFITGPKYRDWGFACEKGWRPWQEFCDIKDKGKVGIGCD